MLLGLWKGAVWFLGHRTQQGVAGCTLASRQVWSGGCGLTGPEPTRQAAPGLLPPLSAIVHGGLEFEEVLESGLLPVVSLLTFHLGPYCSTEIVPFVWGP